MTHQMLTPDTHRAQLVTAATAAAIGTASADFTAGRRTDSLSGADRHILADLAHRLAARCEVVQQRAPREQLEAETTFARAFIRAYNAHLEDLGAGRQRDAEQLAADVLDVLAALDTRSHAQ